MRTSYVIFSQSPNDFAQNDVVDKPRIIVSTALFDQLRGSSGLRLIILHDHSCPKTVLESSISVRT
jgi:hypothetical protein